MANIFIVEDSIEIGTLIKMLLDEEGHTTTLLGDGGQALAALKKTLPDLIVLDVMMPVVDGYTFCGILQENELTRSIPLIIVTAKDQMCETFKAFPNAVTFLKKPFIGVVLTAMVERALKKKA